MARILPAPGNQLNPENGIPPEPNPQRVRTDGPWYKYLRKLIIQGAHSALPSLARTATPIGAWLRGLLTRAHGNTVVVALAAKLIRIAWALLRNGTSWSVARSAAV